MGSAEGSKTWFSYDYFDYGSGDTQRIKRQLTHLPDVDASRNGHHGTDEVLDEFYDDTGRLIWTKDGDGHLGYTACDVGGAVAKRIVDVDTDETGDFVNKATASGWTNADGLRLITRIESDGLGRPTKNIDPESNVSMIVYNDATREVRTYSGWYVNDNGKPLNTADDYFAVGAPIAISRDDWDRKYQEALTLAINPLAAQVGITSLTSNGGTATANTDAAPGLSTGDTVILSGANESAYNGVFVVTVVDADTFTFTVAGGPSSRATGAIVAKLPRPAGTELISGNFQQHPLAAPRSAQQLRPARRGS